MENHIFISQYKNSRDHVADASNNVDQCSVGTLVHDTHSSSMFSRLLNETISCEIPHVNRHVPSSTHVNHFKVIGPLPPDPNGILSSKLPTGS